MFDVKQFILAGEGFTFFQMTFMSTVTSLPTVSKVFQMFTIQSINSYFKMLLICEPFVDFNSFSGINIFCHFHFFQDQNL